MALDEEEPPVRCVDLDIDEAMECAASLDVLRLRKLVSENRYAQGIEMLEAIVAMLTKMF